MKMMQVYSSNIYKIILEVNELGLKALTRYQKLFHDDLSQFRKLYSFYCDRKHQ